MLALLIALTSASVAADESVWHLDTRVAVAGFPSGLISDTRVQYRTPLHRSDSILFQDTFAGFGVRVAATPAFAEVGPRITLAPIDVFDIELSASRAQYYGAGGIGLLPFDAPANKLDQQRSDRGDESLTGHAWTLTAAPTLKGKLGPIIAIDGWTVSYLSVHPYQDTEADYVYEPYRDLVIGWTDLTVEHQAAVLYEVLPGGDRPMFRVGPTFRDRMALESGDRSITTGALIMGRPGTHPAVPTLVGLVLWYVKDADRVGPIPSVALLASWSFEAPVRR